MDDLISRQAAIDALDTGLRGVEWDKALATAMLKDLPFVPQKGRWIDADMLCEKMYHEAFETDSSEQRWDSGCWIRYKMFERIIKSMPVLDFTRKEGDIEHGCTIIPGCGTDQ